MPPPRNPSSHLTRRGFLAQKKPTSNEAGFYFVEKIVLLFNSPLPKISELPLELFN